MSEYFLVVGGRNEGKTEFLRDCLSHDIEGDFIQQNRARLEADARREEEQAQ